METFWHDLRFGFRTLAKNPGFTIVAMLTLALGIGANTAIFSVVNGVLLRPLSYPESDRIMQLAWDFGGYGALSDNQFRFFAEHAKSFQYLTATANASFTLLGGDQPDRISGLHVTADYFNVLGVQPALGRGFRPEEDAGNGERITVLSHSLWQRRFGGQRDVVGRTILLNGDAYTVIGITSAGFDAVPPADLWVPLAPVARLIGGGRNYTVIARLRPDVTRAQALAEAKVITDAYRKGVEASRFQDMGRAVMGVFPYRDLIASDLRTPLLILFAAVGFVLLIACGNVANLLLARTTGRSREIGIRLAMGASRTRIFRQLATEGLLLSLAGAAVGLLLAQWSVDALVLMSPDGLARAGEIRLDASVLGFTFSLAILTGVLFSAAPATSATRTDLNRSLKEGAGRATAGLGRGRLRSVLAAGEVALSLVLLVGAGLLIRTFTNLLHTDAGFDPRPVLSLRVWMTGSDVKSAQQVTALSESLLQRIGGLPGVEAAAVVAAGLPLQRGGNVTMRMHGPDDPEPFSADFRAITRGYFRTLGVPVLAGRNFTESDAENSQPVTIINEAFARRYFREMDPIGQRVWVSNTWREVVGVVGNVKSYVSRPAPPSAFLPLAQTPLEETRLFEGWFPTNILVRTAGDPLRMTATLEKVVREAAPQTPAGQARSMEQVLSISIARPRFQMTLMAFFSGLAMLLAAVGLYGVISQTTAERTHEIGVRMALGAHPGDILRMVLRQGMALVLWGVGIGLIASLAATRVLQGILFGVTTRDPQSYLAVIALLVLVALAACWIPARRATRVDPMVALRYE